MIRKKLFDGQYELIKTKRYPYVSKKKKSPSLHKCVIGVGGNTGDTPRRLCRLFEYLRRDGHIELLKTAPILKNPPFGYLEQPDFYNTVLLIETDLTPRQLLRHLLRIEKRFGRRRKIKNGPRTLDLDIIFYDAVEIDSDDLVIPHPHWMERDSVKIPMAYLRDIR